MTSELLQKEEEFHKLNAELEMRTKALMHQVDSVMKMQNCIANETKQNMHPSRGKTKVNCENNYRKDNNSYFDSGDAWESYEQDPKHFGISSLTQCLKTKITILQNELDDVKTQFKTKCNELKQLQVDYGKLEEEKNKWLQHSQSHKDQKEKNTNQLATLNSKLQAKDNELISFRKENETLKKELKTISINNTNNELKLNKLLEETEKAKANLKNVKQEEKELRDVHKKQIHDLTCTNKRLEKQVTELSNGFKKQMALIDNLKKQKMYLESAKLIQITEDEFSRVLDWKPSLTEN